MIKIILKIKKPLPPSLPSSLYVRCYGFLRFGPAVRASAMGGVQVQWEAVESVLQHPSTYNGSNFLQVFNMLIKIKSLHLLPTYATVTHAQSSNVFVPIAD